MKNYLYCFEFFSGFYESYFYRQVQAEDDKSAIIQIVSYFQNVTEEDAQALLIEELENDWTIEQFWHNMDLRFFNGQEGYTLNWIKEINFDLDNVGNSIYKVK